MGYSLSGGPARNHYYDKTFDLPAWKILPGEYHVTQRDEVVVTVLGSCVSACVRDRTSGIGGMNHFMLPEQGSADTAWGQSTRFGVNAMEVLLNELAKLGASRMSLEAKVFGGGAVMKGTVGTHVGQRNAEFVLRFMKTEGIAVVADDLLDIYPRKVYFFPRSGRVLVKKLRNMHNDTIVRRELEYSERLSQEPVSGAIELFG
jgi:chemotaxis protein CheD